MTFLAALRHDRIAAPFVIDDPIDGDSFGAYVTHCPAPTPAPGDIVVRDNLGSHKSPEIRAAIEAKGATLHYLPPYLPDRNPIKLMFAKLKAILRKAAERSLATLWKRIGASLNAFTPQECANCFIADGDIPA
jgi:transposase